MAKENMESVKKILLIGFVLAGTVLILLIWIQGLKDTASSGSLVYQSTEVTGSPMVITRPPNPQDSGVSTPQSKNWTPVPAGAQMTQPTATETLSAEKIRAYMTAETDQ